MTALRAVLHAASDTGLKRSHNEDCFALWVSDDPHERREKGVLLMVADGMGGSQAGEVASGMATETVVRLYREARAQDPAADLGAAVRQANHLIFTRAEEHSDQHGMGTTCTAMVIRDQAAWLAHVGDSRAYLVRRGMIRQLTQDHSLVAHLVRQNELTEEQARSDPRRNVVTRSVGANDSIEVDEQWLDEPLEAGDVVLLCSDGLHTVVTDAEMAALVQGADLEQTADALIALANQRGGPDNITVALARIEPDPAAPEGEPRPRAVMRREEPISSDDETPLIRMAPARAETPARARAVADEPLPAARRAPAAPVRLRERESEGRRRNLVLLILAVVVLVIALIGAWWAVRHLMRSVNDMGHAARPANHAERLA